MGNRLDWWNSGEMEQIVKCFLNPHNTATSRVARRCLSLHFNTGALYTGPEAIREREGSASMDVRLDCWKSGEMDRKVWKGYADPHLLQQVGKFQILNAGALYPWNTSFDTTW